MLQLQDKNLTIIAFLGALKLAQFWTDSGPSIKAQQILSGHASSEPWVRVCIGLAFDLSNGSANVTVNQIYDTLEAKQLEKIFLLLAKLAHESNRLGEKNSYRNGA